MKSLLLSICFLAGIVVADYTGSWEYSIDTPEGTYDGELVLVQADGTYTGKLTNNDDFEADVKDLEIDGDKISCYFYFQGYKVYIKGTFADDKLKANIDVEGMQIPFVATKKS